MTEMARHSIEIALANDLREIVGVAARIDEYCAIHKISPETAYAVNLAIEELLSITIIDGYADDEAHRIEVLVRLEEESLVVLLVDDGVAFDPTEAPEPDIEASLVERDGSGLGLLLVNRMMDRVEYLRRDGCNIVTLTKS